MQTSSRDRRPSRGLPVALLVAAVMGGGLFVAPSAFADTTDAADTTTATTAITGTPPHATYGDFYDFTFGTQGFSQYPHFVVDSGTLPSGISLERAGRLAGVTTDLGPGSPIVIRASDGGVDPDATLTFTLPVDDRPPAWQATPPASATIPAGVSYWIRYYTAYDPVATTLTISDGVPPGLAFDEFGELQGTPTTPGTYTFTVTASNGTAPDATFTQTLVVTGSAPSISGDAPDGVQGESYDFTYTVGGPPAPTDVHVVSGHLPAGLDLGHDGHVTGTVLDAPGVYAFTVAADNIVGPQATEQDTITVGQDPLSITGTPPAGGVGEPYDFTFDTEGNGYTGTYLASGTLPRGLQMWDGELSGTPTKAGTYTFTVAVFDTYGNTVTHDVTVQILPEPKLSLTGVRAAEGNSGTSPMTFTIALSRPSTVPVTVHWSTLDGTAKAGSDYQAASGDLTFDPGQTSETVTVQVIGDTVREGNQYFLVRLTQPGVAVISKGKVAGTILDDDRSTTTHTPIAV